MVKALKYAVRANGPEGVNPLHPQYLRPAIRSHFPPVHPIGERGFFAAYLVHAKRTGGNQAKDWCLVETARRGTGGLLQKYLARLLLSAAFTERAHATWKDLRMAAPDGRDWRAAQFQTERVLPGRRPTPTKSASLAPKARVELSAH